jgi:hypothetical protein
MMVIHFVQDRFVDGMEFIVACPKHQREVHFIVRRLDMVSYRGSVEELKQVTAKQAILRCCPGCKREEVPSLPEAS